MTKTKLIPLISLVFSMSFMIIISNLFVFKASAASLPKTRVSTKSLNLSKAPQTKELMAAGQLGGLLYPTDDISIEDSAKPHYQIPASGANRQ